MENEAKSEPHMFQTTIHAWRVCVSAVERFYWDNGFSRAASLAYTTLLSLVPVTFVVFGFLASFAVSNQDLLRVREFIFRQFVPNQATVSIILDKLTEIDMILNGSNFSTVALSFFAITALLLINSIEYALNEIWQVYEPRTIVQRISIFCAILVIAPVVAVTAYYTTKVRVEPFLMGIEAFAPFSTLLNHLLSFLVDIVSFFILYFLVPKAPVKVSSAFLGALVASILFGLAKYYFADYILSFSAYDKIYGAIAVIPIFLFWLYISWTIVLFGCELCYQFQYLPVNGQIWRKQITTVGDAAILLACQSLIYIGRAFKEGMKPPSELELSEKLGCSSLVLKPVIGNLKRAEIISQGDTRDMPLVLQKSPDMISVQSIFDAIFPISSQMHHAREAGTFFHALDALKGEKTPMTLAQLL